MMCWLRRSCLPAVMCFCMLMATSAHAVLVNLGTTKDNTMYQPNASGAVRSNGVGNHFFTGATGESAARRGLVGFDVSSIPSGATIDSVTLTLHMSRAIGPVGTVALHRVTADWGEGASNANGEEGRGATPQTGDATWNHRFFNDTFWTTPGGDFLATPSAETEVGGVDFYSWTSPSLATDVQAWIDGTAANFGWVVLANEKLTESAKRFDTRENPTAEYRPVLAVNYTYIPEPAGLGALAVVVLAVWRRAR